MLVVMMFGQCMAYCSIFGMVMPKFHGKGGNDVIGNYVPFVIFCTCKVLDVDVNSVMCLCCRVRRWIIICNRIVDSY